MTDNTIQYIKKKLLVDDEKNILINDSINDGFSGAEVNLIKVISRDPNLSANYIVKITSDEKAESEANIAVDLYKTAENYRDHLVRLVASDKVDDRTVIIYTYANNSVINSCALTKLNSKIAMEKAETVSYDLLNTLNQSANQISIGFNDFIKSLLGGKLEANGRLEDKINKLLKKPDAESIIFNDTAYPNISYYYKHPETLDRLLKRYIVYTGIVHGDFHGLNIIVSDDSYALIDYDSVRKDKPLLFDHAYLELSVYLNKFTENDLKAWNILLDNLVTPSLKDSCNPFDRFFEYSVREGICKGIAHWCKDGISDDIEIQFTMARIAAGINFLCKKSTSDYGKMAKLLLYISFCLKKLFKLLKHDYKPGITSPLNEPETDEVTYDLWDDFLKFNYPMVLVTNDVYPSSDDAILKHLIKRNWALVIDIGDDNKNPVIYDLLNKNIQDQTVKKIDITANESTDSFLGTTNVLSIRKAADTSFNMHWRNYADKLMRIIDLFYAFNQHKPIIFIFDCKEKSREFNNKLFNQLFYKENPPLTRFVYLGADFSTENKDEFEELKAAKKWHFLSYKDADLLDIAKTLREYLVYSTPSNRKVYIPAVNGEVELIEDDLVNYSTTIELVYQGCQDNNSDSPEAGNSFGENFYKGNEATWADIANHYDLDLIDKVTYDSICNKILKCALDGQRIKTFKILHGASTGGTTLSKRILWDLKEQLPCARLKKYTDRTQDIIFELYQKTGKTVLLSVEKGQTVITDEDLNKLCANINFRNGKLIIIQNIRSEEQETNSVLCTLKSPMPYDLAQNFERKFSEFAKNKNDGEKRIELLKKTTYEESQRTPFFYGFYTFQEEYNCLDRLNSTVKDCTDNERELLNALALVTIYSQNICVSDSEIKDILQLEGEWNRYTINEGIKASIKKILIYRNNGYRICHPIIADRVLCLLNHNSSEANLFEATCKYIKTLSRIYGQNGEYADNILKELVIDRPFLDFDKRARFSPLIEKIDKWDNKKALFNLLIQTYPDNPHYYNHMARLLSCGNRNGDISPQFNEAIEYAKKSIVVAKTGKSTHMTTLAWIYGQKVIQALEDNISAKRNKRLSSDLSMIISEIQYNYSLAANQFEEARKESGDFERSSYYYYPQISLECKIISKLINLSDSRDINQLLKSNRDFEKWYIEHFNIAIMLFAKMRSHFDSSEKYVKVAEHLIGEISTDYENQIVKRLNSEYESDDELSIIRRRSMINNLYAKNGFKHTFSDKNTLNTTVKCLLKNIQYRQADKQDSYQMSDVQMWFEFYRRADDFDPGKAQAIIAEYMPAGYIKSYYLFIIGILLRMKCNCIPTGKINALITDSKNSASIHGLNIFRELDAYVDTSKTAYTCPIISLSEIPRDKHGNPANLLTFTGEITEVEQTSGTIWCEALKMNVTFTPNPSRNDVQKFKRDDKGSIVSFNLMFAYSGLRAWNVIKGDNISDRIR